MYIVRFVDSAGKKNTAESNGCDKKNNRKDDI